MVTATATAAPEKNPANRIFATVLPIHVFLVADGLLFLGGDFFLAAEFGPALSRFSAAARFTRFLVFALWALREPWLDLSGLQVCLLRSQNSG